MIRLLALDLDQTLFGSDLTVSPRVQATISQAENRGIWATIATGREARLATRFARELNLSTPIICAQGGCIYDHVHDRVLHEVRLPREALAGIVESARRFDWNIHFETADRLYFPKNSNHPEGLFELVRYSNWVRVGDLLRDMPDSPNKVIVTVARVEDRPRIVEEMKAAFGSRLAIVPSHPHLVEGLPAGVNKGHGLAWLAAHLDIPQAEVMAIGDSEADIPMIEWAGVGVAMGNACDSAKAAADWIAPSLHEDGAAVAIGKFGLGRQE